MIVHVLRGDYLDALVALVAGRLAKQYVPRDPAIRGNHWVPLSARVSVMQTSRPDEVRVIVTLSSDEFTAAPRVDDSIRLDWDSLTLDANRIADRFRHLFKQADSDVTDYREVL